MRKLKTTMLFIGISVTSFAQNFEGLDSLRLDNGDDVFSITLKTKNEAIHKIMHILDINDRDTTTAYIDKKSNVLIGTYWDDDKNKNRVYLLFCNKMGNKGYRVVVIHQENMYSEFYYLGEKTYIYDPK
jgi:hypothetical protein